MLTATLVDKFFSNHVVIVLEEVKDMKINSQKNPRKPMIYSILIHLMKTMQKMATKTFDS